MSERFDDLLSAVVTSAAGAAREPGAEAARKRGRQRRNRQRLAASTLSLALLGAVGGVAAITMHDPTGVPTAHATSTTSTPASPSAMASASPSPAGSTTSSASSTSSPSGTTTSPNGGVSETWFGPTQVPFQSQMNWVAGSIEHCTGQLSFNSTYASGCVEHAEFGTGHAATKMDDVAFTSRGVPTGDGAWAPPLASQQFYTYASAAQARSAFTYFTQQILPQGQSGGTATELQTVNTTTVSAQSTDAMAIDSKLRDQQGNPAQVEGNYSPASDRHYFFAVKDNVLEVLVIWGGPSISDTSNDAAILASVVSAL